jgi:TorA maturation chaperone TorD
MCTETGAFEMITTLMPGRTAAVTLGDLAAAYGVASRLVLAPADGALLVRLGGPGLLEDWPLHRCEETVRGLSALRRSMAEPEPLEALEADYQQLFVTPPSCVPAPYEAAYRPFERLHLDLPHVDVPEDDERHVFGLSTPDPARREGGHLGLELAYAGRLCLAAHEAAERGDEVEAERYAQAHRTFLEEHLMRWAPGCLREAEADAATHFYRGAAALALGVLAHAHERLR